MTSDNLPFSRPVSLSGNKIKRCGGCHLALPDLELNGQANSEKVTIGDKHMRLPHEDKARAEALEVGGPGVEPPSDTPQFLQHL